MIAVVQRVSQARVTVDDETVGEIALGLLALVSILPDDTDADIARMTAKLTTLRIFPNADKHFDLDVRQIGGAILLVSNFTVAADTAQSRRPSFSPAAPPDVARPLFDQLVESVRATQIPTETGRFAASMKITLTNEGPATFLVNTRG